MSKNKRKKLTSKRKPRPTSPPTMKANPVNASWEGFARVVIPGASELQRTEMRKAFFAGAAMVFVLVQRISEASEDAAVANMKVIDAELREFGEALDVEVLSAMSIGDA